jgi:hypothetical protein
VYSTLYSVGRIHAVPVGIWVRMFCRNVWEEGAGVLVKCMHAVVMDVFRVYARTGNLHGGCWVNGSCKVIINIRYDRILKLKVCHVFLDWQKIPENI